MKVNARLFKIAYKKLKSSLYYDKTQSIVRDRIVEFETENDNIDKCLENFAESFLNPQKREKLFDEIISGITFFAFPKSLNPEGGDLIRNYSGKRMIIKDNQYFINMDIRGHILGVLWLLTVGYRVDKNIYVNSYGNRIREKLYNEFSEEPTYSPYLFEPYFQQYESWRDKAMDAALQHLHEGQDVAVMTLDFRRFYYSVDITKELMGRVYEDNVPQEDRCAEFQALNEFVYRVIEAYASKFQEFNGMNILPIGFLPSNVLANYALKNFDKAILDGWNPIYFGRYVDDVIIVDKIEPTSDLFKKTQEGELEKGDIVSFFLEQCTGWNGLNGINCEYKERYALFHKGQPEEENNSNEDFCFELNKIYNPLENDKSKIIIQDKKLKIFYFKTGESDALLTCFRENIAKNKSEFRHMPEDEAVFQKDDYSVIYDLQNDETINKFRGINGIAIDKFELSKLLGKHLRIGGMINDVREAGFETQILKIMTPRVAAENYNVWEKIFEILAINEAWEALKKITDIIVSAIEALDYKNDNILLVVRKTMYDYLLACMNRALALVWGSGVDELIKSLCAEYIDGKNVSRKFIEKIYRNRKNYCKTRMIDKSVMPIFIDMLDLDKIYETTDECNLTVFDQVLIYCKQEWKSSYVYYPFLITMYDFSMIFCVKHLWKPKKAFYDFKGLVNDQIDDYVHSNYQIAGNHEITKEVKSRIRAYDFKKAGAAYKRAFLVSVDNGKKDKIKLAIANVRLNHHNFEQVIIGRPNRSYQRYRDLSKVINEALDERADMLIMPESYLPFEWLTPVARTCARNNLAVVTGIEHIKIKDRIYNLTAVILPFDDPLNKNAVISFHLKTHYAPAEKQEINGYRYDEVAGDHYELYQWHECYFPVYCCYELTSITERSLFQSYADFLVAIEWNKDINYYSNILESLSRDIHCYCVQVNSSDYGDSRITKPSRTEEKDIMRTKGGRNSTILVDEIDIAELREFQLKEYNLQALDRKFKPTPPGFDPEVVLKKIRGESLI